MHEVTGDERADNVFLISRASWGTERPWRVEEKQEWGDKHKNKDKYEQEVSENSNKSEIIHAWTGRWLYSGHELLIFVAISLNFFLAMLSMAKIFGKNWTPQGGGMFRI